MLKVSVQLHETHVFKGYLDQRRGKLQLLIVTSLPRHSLEANITSSTQNSWLTEEPLPPDFLGSSTEWMFGSTPPAS